MIGVPRLDKLYPALTARERFRLVLQALKEGKDEDPPVRLTMPREQVTEFNRLIHLMNGVNIRLGPFACLLYQMMETVSQRLGWLASLTLCDATCHLVRLFLLTHAKEPITESEYAVKKGEAAKELVPVDELAAIEADEHDGWRPKDMMVDEEGQRCVSDTAWERFAAERETLLRRLVKEKALAGRRSKGRLAVEAESYYAWRGQAVPVHPERGLRFEIVPDSEARYVDQWRVARERLFRELSRYDLVAEAEGGEDREETARGIREALEEKMRESIRYLSAYLGAVIAVIDDVAQELDGDDPCQPELRSVLASTRSGLDDVVESARRLMGPMDAAEPDEEALNRVNRLLMREV